jgi:hypothetical protein
MTRELHSEYMTDPKKRGVQVPAAALVFLLN